MLTRLAQGAHRCQARTDKIADLARSMQFGKIDRIPPVGLDPVAGPARDQRRGNDRTLVSSRRQLPLDPIATGTGLVTKP